MAPRTLKACTVTYWDKTYTITPVGTPNTKWMVERQNGSLVGHMRFKKEALELARTDAEPAHYFTWDNEKDRYN